MGKSRNDITNQEVIDLYKLHGNKVKVAMILGCSERLVHDAIRGLRKDTKTNIRLLGDDKLCTCCKQKVRGKNLRFLCPDCFSDPPVPGEDVNWTCHVPSI